MPLLLTIRLVTSIYPVPQPQRACSLVWAYPRSLAATSRITDLFSFPPGTEMVHFPGFALANLCIQLGVTG